MNAKNWMPLTVAIFLLIAAQATAQEPPPALQSMVGAQQKCDSSAPAPTTQPSVAAAVAPQAPAAPQNTGSTPQVTPPLKPSVYKWTDAEGKTHYGDIRPNKITDAVILPPAPQNSSSPRVTHYNKVEIPPNPTPDITTPPPAPAAIAQASPTPNIATPQSAPETTAQTNPNPNTATPQSAPETTAQANPTPNIATPQSAPETTAQANPNPNIATPQSAPETTTNTEAPTTNTTTTEQKLQVYKWTDAEGEIHYSNLKPQDSILGVQTISIKPDPKPSESNSYGLTARYMAATRTPAVAQMEDAVKQQIIFNHDVARLEQQEFQRQQQQLSDAWEQQRRIEDLERQNQRLWEEKARQELAEQRRSMIEQMQRSPPPPIYDRMSRMNDLAERRRQMPIGGR